MDTNNADLELGNLFNVQGKVALVTGGGNQSVTFLTNTSDHQ